MPNVDVRLALRLLWRDWRSGELTLLLASVVIAVATVTTITLFVDRLQQALEQESATFLAADRVIEHRDPISETILEEAAKRGLAQAETLRFLTMAFTPVDARLAAVKAVSGGYPLRGALKIAEEPFTTGVPTEAIPAAGELWVESRLLELLELTVGDPLDIGFASFTITRVIVEEPDRGGGFSDTGPRVLMNMADVPATQVVKPGSRQSYRYLFAGDGAVLDDFAAWAGPRLPAGARMFDVRESSEDIGHALEQAERFLLLGGLLGVVLAGIAIALAAQRYSLRHYDHVAIMKTLGAAPATIDRLFLTIFIVLGAVAALAGSLLGFLAQVAVVVVLQPDFSLPAPGLAPLWLGLATGFICLLAFALPPLLKLRATAPLRVIRRDFAETSRTADILGYGAGVGGILGLLWWYSGNLLLTVLTFAGATAVAGAFAILAFLLLRSGRALGMQAGSVWRLALAGLQQRGRQNTTQILAFGLAIMLILITFLVRTALITEWQAQLPTDAPNHFAFNISADEVEPMQTLFEQNSVTPQSFFALVRGTIDEVEALSGAPWVPPDEHMVPGPGPVRNLTAIAALPADNQIVAGAWWPPDYDGPPLVSLEADFAAATRLSVGDAITFALGQERLTATVASIRTVRWETLQPNFFLILSPGALAAYPSTFVTAFHLPPGQKLFLNDLLRAHPTTTVIEVDAIIEQIQTIIDRVTLALEIGLLLILSSGALVLLTSIQASMDERMRQQAILRTLGASRKLVMGSLAIEFAALGLFAGILATVGAEITAYLLETQIFRLDYTVNTALWIIGPLLGTVLIGTVGTIATLRLVNTPPTTILREVL